jgi:hypothetical protein
MEKSPMSISFAITASYAMMRGASECANLTGSLRAK